MMDTTGKNKLLLALQLVRFPNLLIIVLLQFLVRFCIVRTLLYAGAPEMISPFPDFLLLVIATLLIASGGYIINDVHDIRIDEINKPGKNLVGKVFAEKTMITTWWLINGVAAVIGLYLALRLKSVTAGLVFPFLSVLLWLYAVKYKRSFLAGNIVVALLSALVILIIWYSEFLYLQINPEVFMVVIDNMKLATRIFLAYALFAFLVSLFREIIKDMEDIEGDRLNDCRTIPVVIGIPRSKLVVAVLIVMVILMIVYCSWIAYNISQKWILFYLVVVIGIPLIYLLIKILKANTNEDYHFLSNMSKLLMVAGILSMQLISVSNNSL